MRNSKFQPAESQNGKLNKLNAMTESPDFSSDKGDKKKQSKDDKEVFSTSQVVKFNQSSNRDLPMSNQQQSVSRQKIKFSSKNVLELTSFEPNFSIKPKFPNHLNQKSFYQIEQQIKDEKKFEKYFK